MTPAQFDAISTLASLRAGSQREAARLHLVDGLTRPQACAQVECSRQALHNTLAAIKRALALAHTATGTSPP